jgi:hypothetical protein
MELNDCRHLNQSKNNYLPEANMHIAKVNNNFAIFNEFF